MADYLEDGYPEDCDDPPTKTKSSSSKSSSSSSSSSSSGKRRQHTVSPFYFYCREFVDDCLINGRPFRNTKQGYEAAALKWNALTKEEKEQWRETYREERKRCAEGNSDRMKNKNGERGDPLSDPTDLGILKDMKLKREKDIRELKGRWVWVHTEKSDLKAERFLVINAISNRLFSPSGFSALAIIEFSLANGITDEYSVDLTDVSLGSLTSTRYEAIRRVLNWPSKLQRELGGRAPIYFALQDQLAAVFDALTYVDPKKPAETNWSNPKKQISLDRDLATVEDLISALYDWFQKPKSTGTETTHPDPKKSGGQDCLVAVRQYVTRILDEFAYA